MVRCRDVEIYLSPVLELLDTSTVFFLVFHDRDEMQGVIVVIVVEDEQRYSML